MDGQKRMEEKLENREIRDRRDNIILHGVPEGENGVHEDSVSTF